MTDRKLQRELLERIVEKYPGTVDSKVFRGEFDDKAVVATLHYLEEHGLIEASWVGSPDRGQVAIARATARGCDFLAEDGGLGAILNVVTIRLHEDTLKDRLIKRIEESPEPEMVKSKMLDAVKGLPAEVLRTITVESVKRGLPPPTEILTWIQTYLTVKGHQGPRA